MGVTRGPLATPPPEKAIDERAGPGRPCWARRSSRTVSDQSIQARLPRVTFGPRPSPSRALDSA